MDWLVSISMEHCSLLRYWPNDIRTVIQLINYLFKVNYGGARSINSMSLIQYVISISYHKNTPQKMPQKHTAITTKLLLTNIYVRCPVCLLFLRDNYSNWKDHSITTHSSLFGTTSKWVQLCSSQLSINAKNLEQNHFIQLRWVFLLKEK